jgi:hypothetical protein
MQLTWLDVMAGNIAGALWIVALLHARRTWLETRHWIPAALVSIFLFFGLGILLWRMGIWAEVIERPLSEVLR